MLTFAARQQQTPTTKPHRPSIKSVWHPQHPQVRHILRSTSVQPKLAVGAPNDKYEQEADRVANQIMQMQEPSSVAPTPGSPKIQRLCEKCEAGVAKQPNQDEDELIQAKHISPNESSIPNQEVETQITALRQGSGGAPLSSPTRHFFEQRFGQNFSDVRIHTDATAAGTAKSINAKAFTLGRDIVFGSGQYMPDSSSGKRLLAHELTHVMQQRQGVTSSGIQRTMGDGHDMKAGCKDLCGCPLPSSGFTGTVGGLARTLANATAFHEESPQPNQDRRQLLCPPTNTSVKIQKIIPSGGITFLEVFFCDGPLPDKKGKNVTTALIQQRFVEALPTSITSETVETSPGARTRTDIGVGENVTLTHSSSCSVTWATTAGTIFPVGNTAVLTAPDTAQSITVTAGGASKTFNVIAPTSVAMDIAPGSGVKHTKNNPDSGILARVFLGPDTVNFTNVSYRELDVAGVPSPGAGAYSCNPFSSGHCVGAVGGACPPILMTNTVVATKGTKADDMDCAYSGHCKRTPPFTPGSITLTIPYEYRVGTGSFHSITNVTQVHTLAKDASTLTTDKSTARGATTVATATTTIAACP